MNKGKHIANKKPLDRIGRRQKYLKRHFAIYPQNKSIIVTIALQNRKMSLRPGTHLNTEKTKMDPFKDLEEIHQTYSDELNQDDETVPGGKKYTATRIQIMVSTQATEKSAEALLKSTRELMSALRNKLPAVKFAKWNDREAGKNGKNTSTQIPMEVEKAEQYIQNFSRYSKSNKGYFRIQLIHDEETSEDIILEVGKTFNIPQQQSFYRTPSQAITPVTIGLIAGSTEAMIESPDLLEILKLKTKDMEIGFSWRFIQTGKRGKYDNDQKAIYIETESTKANELKKFLNVTLNEQQTNIFGVHLSFIPSNTYPTKQQQTKLQKYAPVQANLISNMREMEIEIGAFMKISTSNEEGDNTITSLIEALIQIESIVSKQGIKRDKILSFYGKVFYSVITNAETKQTVFQYLTVNEKEATSILRAFPLFIRDHFEIEEKTAESYCRSSLTTMAKNGQWDPETRSFYSQQDLKEQLYFENLQLITEAQQSEQFIDPNHQRVMNGRAMDDETAETNLHNKEDQNKGTNEGAADGQVQEDTSTITDDTGSTRTSKAKRFADEARKEITLQLQQQKKKHIEEIELHKRNSVRQETTLEQQNQKIKKLETLMEKLLNQTVIPEEHKKPKNIATQEEEVRENILHTPLIEKPAEEENNKAKEKVDNLPEEEDQAELYERLERDYYEMPRQQSEDSEDSDLISIKKTHSNWKKQKDHISIDTELEEESDNQEPNRQNSDKVPEIITGSPKRKNRSQRTNNKQQKRAASGSTRGGKKW